MPIQVIVAEAGPLMSEGLALALSQEPDLTASTVAGSLPQVIERCRQLAPCVLLAAEPFLERTDLSRRLRPVHGAGAVPILVLGSAPDPDRVLHWLRQGCMGYLSCEDSLATVRKAVLAVAGGQIWARRVDLAVLLQQLLSPARPGLRLTEREQEVLHWIAAGLNNAEIADMLYISVETVRWHMRRLFAKIGAHDRAGAIEFALRRGLGRATSESSSPTSTPAPLPVGKAYWNQKAPAVGITHQFPR